MITVTGLAVNPIKGMRVREVRQIELDRFGARGDRAFYLIDERGRMVNGKQVGELQTIAADYDIDAETLELTFADGSRVAGPIEYGETLDTRFFSRPYPARELRGPWARAVSELLGRPLRLVEPETAVDRGAEGGASLISTASLRRLAQLGDGHGNGQIDARRFRMLIEIDGIEAHGEDAWIGRLLRVGPALVRIHGNIGRCMVTTRNPDTGEVDLPMLQMLGEYRRELDSTEPLPFGIYGQVLEGGTLRLGDFVSVTDEPSVRR